MWRYALILLGALTLVASARGGSDAPILRISAQCEDLRPVIRDTVLVRICATNDTQEPIAAWLAADYTWHYVPSDSLRAAYKVRIDSVEAAGGHVCTWHPTSFRISRFTLGDEPFEGDSASLAPGASYRDTLVIGVDSEAYVSYPGAFVTTIAIWAGTPGEPCAQAREVGSAVIEIPIPR